LPVLFVTPPPLPGYLGLRCAYYRNLLQLLLQRWSIGTHTLTC